MKVTIEDKDENPLTDQEPTLTEIKNLLIEIINNQSKA